VVASAYENKNLPFVEEYNTSETIFFDLLQRNGIRRIAHERSHTVYDPEIGEAFGLWIFKYQDVAGLTK